MREPTVELLVLRRVDAAAGVVLLDLGKPDGSPLPSWAPGAHIDVVLPGDLGERQYSLCGDPATPAVWRIGVLHEPAGRGGSVWLHDRAPGDAVRVRGPRNHFAFTAFPGREYLFVAGGIGITPISAMVAAAARADVPWRLVYLGRARGGMAFLDEIEAAHPDRVTVYAADEGVRADVADLLAASPDAVVYACGPTRLLDAVEAAGEARRSGSVHLERFQAKQVGEPVWDEPFEVELLLSGITVTVPPEKSILDVVEEHDVLALSSCRVGTCGTCETPIIDGEIDHRDSVLSPEEQDDNFAMMICVSRAACPRITLEL